MSLRDVKTGRIVSIRLCADALAEGRIVQVRYYSDGQPYCPEHKDSNACLETYHAQSRMAAWRWRGVWRTWRRWKAQNRRTS
jgi:hypothetical protein